MLLLVVGFLMMAFDSNGSDSIPIGTFSSDLKGMGKAIDCRNDGTKVTNPIYLRRNLKDLPKIFSIFLTECCDPQGQVTQELGRCYLDSPRGL
jgi:hypothetical protein